MSLKSLRSIIFGSLAACAILAVCLLAARGRPTVYSGITAHEWGTFTSVAGNDGRPVDWSPLTGSTDLPSFVEHFRDAGFKLGLRGTVRMETPVLYFYSAREQTVSVKVIFTKGVITEWYPRATRIEPRAELFDASLYQPHAPDGSIAWNSVTLSPSSTAKLPQENHKNHYYAARQTTSTPLRVSASGGNQYEKFLFYRGVGAFAVPIAAYLTGDKLQLRNLGHEEIPNTILFERRGEKLSWHIGGALHAEGTSDLSLDTPEQSGSIDSLARDLEGMLVAQGLYQNEAHAMVETWRDSWFEEGSRLLYIVPERFVNSVLPLNINPAPEQIVRVFVGRLEIVTPATQSAVEQAFATHDDATLKKYGRFLEPILQTMIKTEANPAHFRELQADLNSVYSSQVTSNMRRTDGSRP